MMKPIRELGQNITDQTKKDTKAIQKKLHLPQGLDIKLNLKKYVIATNIFKKYKQK